jgi:hypothetical protein
MRGDIEGRMETKPFLIWHRRRRQSREHYEMAGYLTAISVAEQVGEKQGFACLWPLYSKWARQGKADCNEFIEGRAEESPQPNCRLFSLRNTASFRGAFFVRSGRNSCYWVASMPEIQPEGQQGRVSSCQDGQSDRH